MKPLKSRATYDRRTILDSAARARDGRRVRRAIRLYRRVLAVEPSNVELHAKLAPLLAASGAQFDAWRSFRFCARAAILEKKPERAAATYREAGRCLPRQIAAWEGLAEVEMRRGGEKRRHAWTLLLVIAMQTVFWLAFTHVKSRFWLPGAVPAALLAALGLGALAARARVAQVVTLAGLVAYGLVPLVIFAREADGHPMAAIGATGYFTGDRTKSYLLEHANLDQEQRRALLADAPAAYFVNHALPPTSRVLLVGEATPFYYRGDAIAYQTTWDRGPLSDAMRAAGDDPAAWMTTLADSGFTHLLVNATMLRIWEDAGWNDPLLTADRVVAAAEGSATLLWRSRDGIALYRLAPRSSAP